MTTELGLRLVKLNYNGPAAKLYLTAEMQRETANVFEQPNNCENVRRLAMEIDDGDMVAYGI